jgi:hypothetical protein
MQAFLPVGEDRLRQKRRRELCRYEMYMTPLRDFLKIFTYGRNFFYYQEVLRSASSVSGTRAERGGQNEKAAIIVEFVRKIIFAGLFIKTAKNHVL